MPAPSPNLPRVPAEWVEDERASTTPLFHREQAPAKCRSRSQSIPLKARRYLPQRGTGRLRPSRSRLLVRE